MSTESTGACAPTCSKACERAYKQVTQSTGTWWIIAKQVLHQVPQVFSLHMYPMSKRILDIYMPATGTPCSPQQRAWLALSAPLLWHRYPSCCHPWLCPGHLWQSPPLRLASTAPHWLQTLGRSPPPSPRPFQPASASSHCMHSAQLSGFVQDLRTCYLWALCGGTESHSTRPVSELPVGSRVKRLESWINAGA